MCGEDGEAGGFGAFVEGSVVVSEVLNHFLATLFVDFGAEDGSLAICSGQDAGVVQTAGSEGVGHESVVGGCGSAVVFFAVLVHGTCTLEGEMDVHVSHQCEFGLLEFGGAAVVGRETVTCAVAPVAVDGWVDVVGARGVPFGLLRRLGVGGQAQNAEVGFKDVVV